MPVVLFLLLILACNLAAAAPLASPDVIASCMKATPHVEESCKSSAFPGWPYGAKDCSYNTPIGALHVTVADAPAERVAAWINNATLYGSMDVCTSKRPSWRLRASAKNYGR